jgi:hypothetical protein
MPEAGGAAGKVLKAVQRPPTFERFKAAVIKAITYHRWFAGVDGLIDSREARIVAEGHDESF